MKTIEDICENVHRLLRQLPRHKFPFNEEKIPLNGIYVFFEKGESGHRGNRIVRIGTHTGQNQLCLRLRQHFIQEKKDRSIFRKNIGRCLLNHSQDPFLADWNLDLTTRKNRLKFKSKIDHKKQARIEKKVSEHLRQNMKFSVFEVLDKETRLLMEARLISIVSRCEKCTSSTHWLGSKSPVTKIKESGLWQVMHLYKDICLNKEHKQLIALIRGQ